MAWLGLVHGAVFDSDNNLYTPLNQSSLGYIYSFDYQQRGAFRALPILLPTAGLRGEL